MTAQDKLARSVKLYLKPRMLTVFAIGISSGLPLTLILSTLSFWLSTEGVSRTSIGLFAALGTPYTLKFLWSPLIDRVPVPFLSRLIGRRRSWLILVQAGLIPSIMLLGFSDPSENLGLTALAAFLVASFSATQDIIIDAYRIEILPKEEQAAGAAMAIGGYRFGNLLSGAGAIAVAGIYGYEAAYFVSALVALVGLAAALFYGEPAVQDSAESREIARRVDAVTRARGASGPLARAASWLYMAVIAPFQEFMSRPGWLMILLFVLIYKIGDSMASVMTAPLIQELGFTEGEFATANKLVGFATLIAGTYLGGAFLYFAGMFRALLITGIFMMVTNLFFIWLYFSGHDVFVLALTIGFENFATGMGLSVFVAYLSGLCNVAFTATQYALLSSLMAVGRTLLSSSSGFIVDSLGWVEFFVFTTVIAVPGLVLLVWLWRRGFQVDEARPGRAAAIDA